MVELECGLRYSVDRSDMVTELDRRVLSVKGTYRCHS